MEKKSLVNSSRYEDSTHWDTSLLDTFKNQNEGEDDLTSTKINPFEDDEDSPGGVSTAKSLPRIVSPPQKVSQTDISKQHSESRPKSQTSTKAVDKKTSKEGQVNSPNSVEHEDFLGLFTNEVTSPNASTPNNGGSSHFEKESELFDNFDEGFGKSPTVESKKSAKKHEHKNDEFSSDSHEAEMSDKECNRIQNMFGGNDSSTILPPPKANSTKNVDKSHTPTTNPTKHGKSRKSEPLKAAGESAIPERKIGVDLNKEGTNVRVRSDIKQTSSSKEEPAASVQDTKSPRKYDCLPELKRGTALLKYGKQGYPHFRQFNLSAKNDELVWFSNKKKLDQSSIKIKDINEILTGQHTKEFRRISWTSLSPASFSIWYDGHTRSLNLVAKSVDEMKMWVEGLRQLQEKACRGEDMSKVHSLEVTVDFKDRNRPQSRRHSGNFLRSHEAKEKEVDPGLYQQLVDDLKSLSKLFQEIKELSKNEIVQKSHEGASINQILSELEERIEELRHEVVNTRSTKIAENDVWRTRVDMQTLREKILVLIKENNKKSKRRFSVF